MKIKNSQSVHIRFNQSILVGLGIFMFFAASVNAATPRVRVLPPASHPYGLSYSQWSAAWWQWSLSLPADQNPLFDETGCANGANGQSGPVWFLAGVINVSGTAVRECTIPAGKALFFPVINAECSSAEVGTSWYCNSEAECRACAQSYMDMTCCLGADVDGVPIPNLQSYRFLSPVFEFDAPENNVLGVAPGTGYHSVSDGIWLMLAPLPAGKHIVHFTGTWPGEFPFVLDITYLLTVEK